jgi:hypothetical protein
MQTGVTLSAYFDQKTSAAYTGYLDPVKKNRLFKDALLAILEREETDDQGQKQWDQITLIKKTQHVLPVRNNFIVTAPLQITNVTYSVPNFTITTFLPHGLSIGDTISLQNVAGFTSTPTLNGTTFTLIGVTSKTLTFSTFGATGTWTAGTGQVTSTYFLNDYWHLRSIKNKYYSPIYNVNITGASNTTPIKVTVDIRNNIRSGEQLTIAGVLGNTNANGIFYVKSLNNKMLALYTDVNFQNPVAGNGNYISGGTFKRTDYYYCQPYESSAKIGVLNLPDTLSPSYEIADNQIKLYPQDQNCVEVTVDYFSQPPVVIDVTNSVTDLSVYYPEKFLFAILNEAVILYSAETRDPELSNSTSIDQQKNP